MVQQFQRYLPTAFDEGMTLLEKVNKIIISLNRIGKLSNDVLDQWNQVMEWVMADGLDTSIDSKIDSMLQDGSLATIIGNAITDLGAQLSALTSTVDLNKTTLEAEITSNVATLQNEITANTKSITDKLPMIYVEDFISDVTGLGTSNEDWTIALQNALNESPVYKTVILPMKTLRYTDKLEIPFGTSLIGYGNASILQADFGSWKSTDYRAIHLHNNEGIDYHENGVNTRISDFCLIGLNNSSKESIGIECSTVSTIQVSTAVNYSTSFTHFQNLYVSHFDKAFNLPECWMSTFSDISVLYCRIGFNIIGKSVNNFFNNLECTNFGHGNTPNAGKTAGFYLDNKIYSDGGTTGFPEGIMISNSLIFGADNAIYANNGILIRVTDCILDGCTDDAVTIGLARNVSVRGCYIYIQGVGKTGVKILDELIGDSQLSIAHNDFVCLVDGNAHYGVKADLNTRERYGIIIDGNQFYGFTNAIWLNHFDKGKVVNNHGRVGSGAFIYCQSDCNKTIIDGNTSEDNYSILTMQPYTDQTLIIGDNYSSVNQTSFKGKVTLPAGQTSVALPNNFYNTTTGETYFRAITNVSPSGNVGNWWITNEFSWSDANFNCSVAPVTDVAIRYEVKAIPYSGI
jgi:hypothetical protein